MGRRRLDEYVLRDNLPISLARKNTFSGQHEIEDTSKRVQVTACVNFASSFALLWRHVQRSSDHNPGSSMRRILIKKFCNTKIENLGRGQACLLVMTDHDIARLQVSVYNRLIVSSLQRAGYLTSKRDCLGWVQSSTAAHVFG